MNRVFLRSFKACCSNLPGAGLVRAPSVAWLSSFKHKKAEAESNYFRHIVRENVQELEELGLSKEERRRRLEAINADESKKYARNFVEKMNAEIEEQKKKASTSTRRSETRDKFGSSSGLKKKPTKGLVKQDANAEEPKPTESDEMFGYDFDGSEARGSKPIVINKFIKVRSDEKPHFKAEKVPVPASELEPVQFGRLEAIEKPDEPDELQPQLSEEEMIQNEIRSLKPALRPFAYNLAYYVNESVVLQKFIEMGVAIHKWDADRKIGELVLKLDIERDIKPRLIFLHDLGVREDSYAFVITKNPLLFAQPLEDLKVRVEYLKSKKFSDAAIVEIVTSAPKWLNISVEDLDTRLGWLQKEFQLKGDELRDIVTRRPKLVTLPLKLVSDVRFCLKEFLEYDDKTVKAIIKSYPRLFTKDFRIIQTNFNYLMQVMKLSADEIALHPPILQAPLVLLKSRFAYLKHLNRVQFDPTQPNFISLANFAVHDEKLFCEKFAKTSVEEFKKFLKTI